MTDPKEEVYEAEGIEDARTGEIIPRGVSKQTNTLQVQLNINLVGTLELDEQAEEVLGEPLKPEDIKIRPDGLVYLPWTWYAERLNRAFGRLKWGLVPQSSPQSKNTGNNNVLVVWGNWLVIKGIPVSFAVGETSYRTDNYTMSYADAIEGARSISLARNCKQLGMALELWDADFVKEWKEKFAETYTYKNKTLWRKKSVNAKSQASKSPQEAPGATQEEKATQDTPNGAGMTPGEFLKNVLVIQQIGKKTGKKAVDVIKFLNTLDKSVKFTPEEIEVMIGEQK